MSPMVDFASVTVTYSGAVQPTLLDVNLQIDEG